ncbi:MAG: hypothetical protein A3D92_18700, partial [Bacteroidetes bacterium RIFCSPHIGHO2_02_FULL_44_7]
MATYDAAFEKFTAEMIALGYHYHEGMYHAITKHLGPSIHDKDASLVACSSAEERTYIKEHFLIGKLGLEDGVELDEAIQRVCEAMGESNTNKHRATFYYLLTAILQKEDVFIE